MDVQLSKTLSRWARNDEQKAAQLATWLDEAIIAIAEGKGASMASATGNGVSVNMMGGSLTVSAWASTLSHAICLIDAPQVSKIVTRIA